MNAKPRVAQHAAKNNVLGVYGIRNAKVRENLYFSLVAAAFEKADSVVLLVS